MTSIEEIEHAIEQLPPAELKRLREWFAQFEADRWDRQLEADAAAGKLDARGEEALFEFRGGKTTEL